MIIRYSRRLLRLYSTSATPPSLTPTQVSARAEISKILSTPSWSVSSLLPSSSSSTTTTTTTTEQPIITPAKLHHLLRLSALPPPASPEEEARLLRDLHDQLHFVNAIQAVDTTNVKPLRAIRDENLENIGITLEDVLKAERENEERGMGDEQGWDVLKNARRTEGRYFVVEGGMGMADGEEGDTVG